MSKSPTITKSGKRLPPIHPGKILLEDMLDEKISINGWRRPFVCLLTGSA
jgi:hypothetical protein